MKVSKPLDLVLLGSELTAAGVPHGGLIALGTLNPNDPEEVDLLQVGPDGAAIELPPEAVPVVAAHDATPRAKTFELAEDTERLALVNERAQTDPAFAALAELTLGKQGV